MKFPEREILKQLTSLALPMVISQGAFALMIFTDRLFLSMVSPLHMAAGLGGGVASFFCISLFMGILAYSNALVAQYYGAGERRQCARVLTQSLILCLGFMPFLALIGFGVSRLFSLMGHAPEQVELEVSYLTVMLSGAILALIKMAFASFFAGTGKTKVVMTGDLVGVVINVPLTYALIFGAVGLPELGIVGAALGTIIGNLVSLLVLAAFYFAPQHRALYAVARSFVLDRTILTRYLRLGVPAGFESFLNVAAFNLFLLMFQSYGVVQAASAAIVLNWDMLTFIPMLGLNAAVVSLVGRYVGSGDADQVGQVMRAGFVLGLGYTSIVAVTFLVFRAPMVDVFINGDGAEAEAIRQLSVFMMLGLSTYVMADAIIQVAGGSLRGVGDTLWMMKVSTSLHWLVLVLQVLVIKIWQLGPEVSWMVFVVQLLSIAGAFSLRLKSGRWRDRLQKSAT
ncbi:MATE family efflux transporter [Candidatus Pelagadaptatus aseana]|uniref:MATE family efflux transporter n=1 Tax=Candidatus Pelagadaptatus aseana TaxID=3120508 RepID=UPI003C6EA7A6